MDIKIPLEENNEDEESEDAYVLNHTFDARC